VCLKCRIYRRTIQNNDLIKEQGFSAILVLILNNIKFLAMYDVNVFMTLTDIGSDLG